MATTVAFKTGRGGLSSRQQSGVLAAARSIPGVIIKASPRLLVIKVGQNVPIQTLRSVLLKGGKGITFQLEQAAGASLTAAAIARRARESQEVRELVKAGATQREIETRASLVGRGLITLERPEVLAARPPPREPEFIIPKQIPFLARAPSLQETAIGLGEPFQIREIPTGPPISELRLPFTVRELEEFRLEEEQRRFQFQVPARLEKVGRLERFIPPEQRGFEILEKEVGEPLAEILFGKKKPFETGIEREVQEVFGETIKAVVSAPSFLTDVGEFVFTVTTRPEETAAAFAQELQTREGAIRTSVGFVTASLLFGAPRIRLRPQKVTTTLEVGRITRLEPIIILTERGLLERAPSRLVTARVAFEVGKKEIGIARIETVIPEIPIQTLVPEIKARVGVTRLELLKGTGPGAEVTQRLNVLTKSVEVGVSKAGDPLIFGKARVFRTKRFRKDLDITDVGFKAFSKNTEEIERAIALTITEKGKPGVSAAFLIKEAEIPKGFRLEPPAKPPKLPKVEIARPPTPTREVAVIAEVARQEFEAALPGVRPLPIPAPLLFEEEIVTTLPPEFERPIRAEVSLTQLQSNVIRQSQRQRDLLRSRMDIRQVNLIGLAVSNLADISQKSAQTQLQKPLQLSAQRLRQRQQESQLQSQLRLQQQFKARAFPTITALGFVPVSFPLLTSEERKRRRKKEFEFRARFGLRVFRFPKPEEVFR